MEQPLSNVERLERPEVVPEAEDLLEDFDERDGYDEDGNYVPERYRPEKPLYERKDVLYELYWGRIMSSREIGAYLDVGSKTVLNNMRDHGIPRRGRKGYLHKKIKWHQKPLQGFLTRGSLVNTDDEWVAVCRPKHLPPWDERSPGEYEREDTVEWERSESSDVTWSDVA
jgi:hypothetical protein